MAVAVAGVSVGLTGSEADGFLRTVLGAGKAVLAGAGGLGTATCFSICSIPFDIEDVESLKWDGKKGYS